MPLLAARFRGREKGRIVLLLAAAFHVHNCSAQNISDSPIASFTAVRTHSAIASSSSLASPLSPYPTPSLPVTSTPRASLASSTSPRATVSAVPSETAQSRFATPTGTSTRTATATAQRTMTGTVFATNTATPSSTATTTASSSATATSTASSSAHATDSATATSSGSASATSTASGSASATTTTDSTCPPGFYGSRGCAPCPSGFYCPGGQGIVNAPVECFAGYSCPPGASAQQPCPPGLYQPSPGKPSCLPCNAGQYQPNSGQTACLICDEGFWCAAGSAAETPCSPGSFNPLSAQTSISACTACNPGRYQSAQGQSSCDDACEVGCVCSDLGSVESCPQTLQWAISSGSTPGASGNALGKGPHSATALVVVKELVAQASSPVSAPLALSTTGSGFALVPCSDSLHLTKIADGSTTCKLSAGNGDNTAFSIPPVISPVGYVIAATKGGTVLAFSLTPCATAPAWTLPQPITFNAAIPAPLNLLGDTLIIASTDSITAGGLLEAFDSLLGTSLWRFPLSSSAAISPITSSPIVFANTYVAFGVSGTNNPNLYVVDGTTGIQPPWSPLPLPGGTGSSTKLLLSGTSQLLFCLVTPTYLLYVIDPVTGTILDTFNIPQYLGSGQVYGGQAPLLTPDCASATSPNDLCILYLGVSNSVLALRYTGPKTLAPLWLTPASPAGGNTVAALCAVGSDGIIYGTLTSPSTSGGSMIALTPSGVLLFSKPVAMMPSLGCALSSDTNALIFATPPSTSIFSLSAVSVPPPAAAAGTYQLPAILGGVFGSLALLGLMAAYFFLPAFRAALHVSRKRRVRVHKYVARPGGGGESLYQPLNGGVDLDMQ